MVPTRRRLPVDIGIPVQALVVFDVPQIHILVDEPLDTCIIIPRPHVVQAVGVGHHSDLAVVEERGRVSACSVHQFAVGGVLAGICNIAVAVGQGLWCCPGGRSGRSGSCPGSHTG